MGYERLSACGYFVFSRFKYKKTQVTLKWRMKQKIIFHLKRSQFGWTKKMKMRRCRLPNFSSGVPPDSSKVTLQVLRKFSFWICEYVKTWKVLESIAKIIHNPITEGEPLLTCWHTSLPLSSVLYRKAKRAQCLESDLSLPPSLASS